MNDELKSIMIKAGIGILTALASKFHFDPAYTSAYPAIAADVADLLLFAYAVYYSRGMKKVPVEAHATIAGVTISRPGETKAAPVDIAGKIGTGVLIFAAFVVGAGMTDAHAQTKPGVDPIMQIVSKLKILTPEKVQAALDDALANGDPYSPDCWRFLLPLSQAVQTATPSAKVLDKAGGINLPLAYQKARDTRRAIESLKGGLSDNVDLVRACGPMAMDSRMVLDRLILLMGGMAILP